MSADRWSFTCLCARCWGDGRGTRQTPPDPCDDCPNCGFASAHAWCPHLDNVAVRYPAHWEARKAARSRLNAPEAA